MPLQVEPSEISILTALFGWSILPPTPPEPTKGTLSSSRAGSVVPTTPSRNNASRAPSVALREGAPSPRSARTSIRVSSANSLLSQHSIGGGVAPPDATLLHCPLCQRRVGLWAFLPKLADEDDPMNGDSPTDTDAKVKAQPQRQLDILREHRPYCPYVVRSTVLPTFPAPSPAAAQPRDHRRSASVASVASVNSSASQANPQHGAVEGWRAVMAVVSRYGNVQRQRLGVSRAPDGREEGVVEGMDEGNSVEAMVAGVKSRGVCQFSPC